MLMLDIESGSVGVALARLSSNHLPKVFGEWRRAVPLQLTHDTDTLARQTEVVVEAALAHVAEVAARVRGHHTHGAVGEVQDAAVFLSPPWGALSITNRKLEPHPFTKRLQKSLEAFFGPLTVTTEPFGLMAAHTAPLVLPNEGHYLLSTVSGETTELILLENEGSHLHIAAHATLPLGHHYPLRTLLSHGAFSPAEARSALHLHARGSAPGHALEALHAAGTHVAAEFASVAGELLPHTQARSIFVVAGEPTGEWFARSLAASPALGQLFPQAGEVRAVRSGHVSPFVGGHARRPDLPLLLEALFVNTRFNSAV